LADEIKTVAGEGGNDFSGCERPDTTVVDVHGLHGDGDAGFLLGNLLNLHRIVRAFR
jgi:hypothetical protein